MEVLKRVGRRYTDWCFIEKCSTILTQKNIFKSTKCTTAKYWGVCVFPFTYKFTTFFTKYVLATKLTFQTAAIPNLSARFLSFSSRTTEFVPALTTTFAPSLFLLVFSTTPNLSILFLIFSSISAFCNTLEVSCPNLSARLFSVSRSASGAPPIFPDDLAAIPNLAALASFLSSEVAEGVIPNLSALALARSESVNVLLAAESWGAVSAAAAEVVVVSVVDSGTVDAAEVCSTANFLTGGGEDEVSGMEGAWLKERLYVVICMRQMRAMPNSSPDILSVSLRWCLLWFSGTGCFDLDLWLLNLLLLLLCLCLLLLFDQHGLKSLDEVVLVARDGLTTSFELLL